MIKFGRFQNAHAISWAANVGVLSANGVDPQK